MTTVTITIDDPNGLNTNLLFPSGSPYLATSAGTSLTTSGSFDFRHVVNGVAVDPRYRTSVTGNDLKLADTSIDVHGDIAFMKLNLVNSNGTLSTQLIHADFQLDGLWLTFFGGVHMESLAALTVDVLMGRIMQRTSADLVLVGNIGNDTLNGSFLDDTLKGMRGADLLIGGAGMDTASYIDSNFGITVNLATNSASRGHAAGDIFFSIENVTGSSLGDIITGNGVANTLTGGTGLDTIRGGGGNDFIFGEAGGGKLYGDAGNDRIDGGHDAPDLIYGGTGNDEIRTGNGTNTAYGEDGADSLLGGTGLDRLYGGAGNDIFYSDSGNDILTGGLGKDMLEGGPGGDIFDFNLVKESVVGANRDVIFDFDDGNAGDRIDVSALYPAVMVYCHGLAFTAAGQVRINDVAGADVIVEVNVGGTLAADFSIRLFGTTLASMNAGDFIL